LKRLGALSPRATFATFSPGSRSLLRDAERSGELALHVVRLVWWSLAIAASVARFGLDVVALAPIIAVVAVIWLLGLLGLRTGRAFTPARYALVLADAWVAIGAVLVAFGPLGTIATVVSSRIGRLPTAAELGAYVPPMLVYLALTGALRLDPRVAALNGGLAVVSAALYATALGVSGGDAFLVIGMVVLSAVVATNASRILRYMVLKAREEAILQSYVPESLSRDLAAHGALERDGRVEDVTLLVCDIRGFTKLSERLSPHETVALVNEYLDAACPPITAGGGVIDKFMGDGVLAFFEGGGNASRAVGAARRIVDAVEQRQLASGQLRVGVALHSGQVLVGTVGPRTRREYTIISDAVNTLTRLEEMNKTFGSRIVASDATMARVADAERAGFDGPVNVAVRGRESGVTVWVFGAAVPLSDDRDLGDRLRRFVGRDTEQAL
jgi:class 3 adenylate cyclase